MTFVTNVCDNTEWIGPYFTIKIHESNFDNASGKYFSINFPSTITSILLGDGTGEIVVMQTAYGSFHISLSSAFWR